MRSFGAGAAGWAAVVLLLGGCQSGPAADNTSKGEGTETVVTGEPADETSSNANTDETDVNEPESGAEVLPEDFPLPADAVITTSYAEEDSGKRNAMLIFETEQPMEEIASLYQEYFSGLVDKAETMDDKNLIIQGTDEDRQYDWSLIGGVLTGRGLIEITVTWAEL